MNVFNILANQAENRTSELALVCGKSVRSLTYGELNLRCQAYSNYLTSMGIVKGSKVLILKGMSIELYIALLAIFRLGAIAVFIDPAQPPSFIKACILQTKPQAIFAPRKLLLLSWMWPIRWSIGLSLNSTATLTAVANKQSISTTPDWPCNTPALMTFTSGSTGKPKTIVRSHQFLLHQLQAIIPHIELEAGESDLCTMPIFVLANLASGVVSHLPASDVRNPGKINQHKIIDQILTNKIDRIGASPALLERLVCTTKAPESFSRIFTGGAPVLPTLMDRVKAWAPNANVVAIYGSSEAEPISRIAHGEISTDDRLLMKQGSGLLVGKPIEEVTLKIIENRLHQPLLHISNEVWQSLALPCHQIGEVIVHGQHVLSGYLNEIADDENKIAADGFRWHRTGDSGYLDADGRLWLTGRCSAIIEDSIGTLYPFTVEVAAALLLPNITLSACVAWKDRRFLLIENITKTQQDDLLQQLSWAKLDAVVCVKSLPVDKRHNAKIDYPALRKLLPRLLASRVK